MTSFSRRGTASLVAAGLLLSCFVQPATAQWYGRSYGYGYADPPPPGYDPREMDIDAALTPGEIVDRVEAAGYDVLGRPRYMGRTYHVEATTRAGGRVRLVVDAVRGRIVSRTALGRDPTEEADVDDLFGRPAPGTRYGSAPRTALPPSPYDEMPDAAAPPGASERRVAPREASRSDIAPVRPEGIRPEGALPAPTDGRLAPRPDAGAASPERRTEPTSPRASAAPADAGGVQGLNPDRAGTRPKAAPSQARTPAPAAPKSAAAAPSARPATPEKPTAEAAAAPTSDGPRKPVRVIEGVTPMTSGGQQSQPAPQNNVDANKPAAAAN